MRVVRVCLAAWSTIARKGPESDASSVVMAMAMMRLASGAGPGIRSPPDRRITASSRGELLG